jgi:hypothetical protein
MDRLDGPGMETFINSMIEYLRPLISSDGPLTSFSIGSCHCIMAVTGPHAQVPTAGDTFLPRNISDYTIDVKKAVGEEARTLLVEWSGIPADQVDQHVSELVSRHSTAFCRHDWH